MTSLVLLFALAQAQVPEGRGEPVPTTQQVRPPKKGRGFLIGGAAALGSIYLGNVAVAALSALIAGSTPVIPAQTSPLGGLFIPLAGPFVAMADVRNQTAAGIVVLLVDGLAQLASATMLVFGIVSVNSEPEPVTWFVSPSAGGATVTLKFP